MTKSMTSGSPIKLIFAFAIPLFIGNVFQQFYSMADTFIVGRTVGVAALAAVGCTGSLVWFITGFIGGFTSGLSIITAREFGAGNELEVKRSFATSIFLSVILTVLLTILAFPLARYGLELLNTPADLMEDAYIYTVIVYAGIFTTTLFNLMSCVMRALGNSRAPLIFLVVACGINIVLDFVFILFFHMGVAGVAYATVISQFLSGICCVLYAMKHMPELRLRKEHFKLIRKKDIKAHMVLALPIGFQASIIAIGGLILQNALNGLGSAAVAAYTAAHRIDIVATMPSGSIGIAITTYVSQNYGAGKYNRIRQGVRQCAAISMVVSVISGAAMLMFGKHFAAVFIGTTEPQVLAYAQQILSISGLAYWALYMLHIYRASLQGLGYKVIPTFAGFMELVMRALCGLVLIRAFGFTGACFANPLAWLGSCVPLLITYFIIVKKLPNN